MTTLRFPLSIAIAAMMTITAPVFAGPGGHGGGAGGGPHASAAAGMSASRDTNDAKSNSGKHEGAKRGNKGGKARGLHYYVCAFNTGLPVWGGNNLLAEVIRQAGGKTVTAFRSSGMNADFVEVEEPVQESHIPVGGSPRTDMAQNF